MEAVKEEKGGGEGPHSWGRASSCCEEPLMALQGLEQVVLLL